MKNLKKRHELPNFLRLPYVFDISKILQALNKAPEGFKDLDGSGAYGKLADSCHCLQKTFGLKFNSLESAYEYLRKTGVRPKGMNWDYRKFITTGTDGKWEVRNNPYKQLAITEYNPEHDRKRFQINIPRNRLDERQYNKLKPWVIGTYLEKVISVFKGFVTRVRVARMEPGCKIGEHIDYNTDYSIRVHIPLRTNEKCGFYIRRRPKANKEHIQMKPDGTCWFVNTGYKHSVWNYGKTPRDHLILSIASQEDIFGII